MLARTTRGWRLGRLFAVPALAVAVVATMPMASGGNSPAAAAWTPMTPVSVTFQHDGGPTASGHLLGFNDFHGNIDPPTGSGGLVNGTPAGGAEYFATTLKRLRATADASSDRVLTVGR